ncbi:MAG: hypothetical protein ABI576_11845 [Flavobacterium sp.]
MKKIILLLFVFILSPKTFGQNPTYSMKISYQTQNLSGCTANLCSGCNRLERLWKMGNYTLPYNESGFANVLAKNTYNNNLNITEINISIPENNYDVFYFTNYTEKCFMQSNQPVDCVKRETLDAKFQSELYESAVAPVTVTNSCFGIIKVLSYKPNMTLNIPAKYNVTYTNEEYQQYFQFGIPLPERGTTVCSGEVIDLSVSPLGFKRGTYNWQYKIKGGTWKDFKYKNVNNTETTYVARPTFTIADILNTEDQNYTGFIDIRLGSGQNAPFTSSVKLNYSNCAPIIKKTEYLLPPLCYGDNIRDVTVTFDRDLFLLEELRYFQLQAVNPDTNISDGTPPVFYPFISDNNPNNGLITKLDEKSLGVFTYSLTNFKGLNPNATYQIQYQAFQNNTTKGVSISPKKENFKYIEPDPLIFKIIKADNPICVDDPVEISILVSGGNGNYKFYVDDTEQTSPKPVKETDGYYHIRGLIPTAINNIKVMDTNNCIETTP